MEAIYPRTNSAIRQKGGLTMKHNKDRKDSDLPLYERYPYVPLIISIISLLFVITKPVLLCILQWLQR
jgi:hypothetical protein